MSPQQEEPYLHDTITAIATASGQAGIAIIRISGPRAVEIADIITCSKGKKPSDCDGSRFIYAQIVDRDKVIDEVVVLVMRKPHSYTKEDVVEIQGHGGPITTQRILRRVLDEGARMAEPGEFTKRAFLNGRIDLLQAEAVMDLIEAASNRAANAAIEQLEGRLSNKFDALYSGMLEVAANIEATLDFPEDELPDTVIPNIITDLINLKDRFQNLISSWDEGYVIREGIKVVIVGKPNVGKSTLLNTLLGVERAIVSKIPGTTRDSIEESYLLNGIPLRMIDTAGLRNAEDEVELEGIKRAKTHLNRADLYIYMMDASSGIDQEDMSYLKSIEKARTIIVVNKIDLVKNEPLVNLPKGYTVIYTSLVNMLGINELKIAIKNIIESAFGLSEETRPVISERHRNLLLDALKQLEIAVELLNESREDLVALASARIRSALEAIGEATGKNYHDQLLDSIFSRFCIGK